MNDSRRIGPWLVAAVLMAVTALAIVPVARSLFVDGLLAWHVSQPAAIQGGIEAIGLLAVLALAAAFPRRWLIAIAAAACALYLRRHNAELTLLTGIFYLEALFGLGCLILREPLNREAGVSESWIVALVAGMCGWLLLCIFLSLFRLATPAILACLLFAGGAAVLLARRRLLVSSLFRCSMRMARSERVAFALIVGWFLILAARTANVLGHDAIWYIGQGDRLLAPNGSIFESLALVSPVHYFPKMWETLLLPLTALDDMRVQEGFAIAVLGVLLALVWQLAGRLGITTKWRWWLLWILAPLPAIANTALSLKTDLLSACFLLWMCLSLFTWFRHRSADALLHAAAAAALACSTKLTAIPYVGIALVFLAVTEVTGRFHPTNPSQMSIENRPASTAWIVFLAAVLVAIAFTLRTWWLAGVPTIGPDPLMALWKTLGMSLAEPVGTLRWTQPQVWADVPALIYDWLLAPGSTVKMPISWTGNVWIALALAAALMAPGGLRSHLETPAPRSRGLLLALALTGLALALMWRYHSRGSDGNYFLFAVVLATCLAMRAVSGRASSSAPGRASLTVAAFVFGAFHAGHSFVSTAWSPPGTRSFDMNFSQTPWQPGQWRNMRLERIGLAEINAYLADLPRGERGIFIGSASQQTPVLLPIAMENSRSIRYSRPAYVESDQALMRFISRFGIRYVIIMGNAPEKTRTFRAHIEKAGWTSRTDRGGRLYIAPDSHGYVAGERRPIVFRSNPP